MPALAVPALTAAAGWLAKGAIAAGIVWALGPEIIAFIGSVFLNLAAYALGFAGNVFNWLIDRTVVDFANTLKTLGMMGGIDTVWTAFRDISNIVIIGMFVFIAISIILGAKEYGQKKLIAHVLIIAILINFSLLFTKMIIDVSNFTALQFYNAASLPQTEATSAVGSAESSSANGISGRFLNIIGITGFWDTYNQLSDSTKMNGSWSTLGYALTGTALLLIVAGVFLYGAFLLASRAALLVFIMIISPFAFASHLVPGLGDLQYSWKGWWRNLIRCAMFGPLLTIFLWASILILSRATPSNVSFGDFLSNPANSNAWQLVIMYAFTTAFLFISIRFANSFAGTIGGFNWASMVAASPFTFGARAAGLAMRLGIGAPAYFAGKSIMSSARADRDKAAEARRQQEAALNRGHAFSAARFGKLASTLEERAAQKASRTAWTDRLAGSRFNAMDTNLAKKAMKGLGISGIAAGESGKTFLEKSYADQVKARAEAGEKIAAKLAPGKGDEENMRRRVSEERQQHRETLQLAEKQAKELERLPERLAAAQRDLQGAKELASKNRVASKDALDAGHITAAEHATAMTAEENRITKAQEMVNLIQGRVTEVERPRKGYDEETKNIGDKLVAGMGKAAEGIAGEVGARQGDILKRIYGSLPLPKTQNRAVRDEIVDKYKSNRDTAKWRKVFENMRDETTPPPATP